MPVMTRRCAFRYGLLAVFAMLVSTAVAWSCALWSSIPTSRSLTRAQAATVLADGLGAVKFTATPSGLEQSGLGVSLILAGDAPVQVPTRAQLEAGPQGRRNDSFSLVPIGPDDKWIQVVRAGWPLRCVEGATKSVGRTQVRDGVMEPPRLMAEMGVKPRRMLPLYPRWAGLAVNTLFYGAVFWLAIPGPVVARRLLRRRRAQCPGCGYDVGHHGHATCPECGAG